MSKKTDDLAAKLEDLKREALELEAVEEPTEDQTVRMEAIPTEWDATNEDLNKSRAYDEKMDEIRTAALEPSNREAGFSAPNVIVRTDPYENLGEIHYRNDSDPSIRERALRAFEDVKHRGVTDAQVAAVVDRIENIPGAARHALLHGSPAYRSAFDRWMRSAGQNVVFTAEEGDAVRASMALGGATGGYMLPTLLDPTLIHTGTATRNPIRSIARVVEGTQNVWHGVSVGNVTTYWVAENTALTDGTPTFASPSVTAAKLTAYVTGSYEIFEDSNAQAQLPGLIAESMGFAESTTFITGSGSGAPKGIVTALTGTAATVTATTRGAFTTASAVDVFAVVNAVNSRYEDNTTWVGNKATFNTIRQMSTGSQGSYFWTNFNNETAPNSAPLLGSPVVQASDMATAQTSGTTLLVLGDWSQFVIYDRLGTAVEFVQNVVDGSGLPLGQRGLIAHKRVGSDVTDVGAFKLLKT